MLRVTLAGVRGHRVRFLLTTLSVLLGVAFVSGTLVLTESLDRTFTGIFDQANEGTTVYVRGEQGAQAFDGTSLRAGLPLELAEEIESVPGVRRAVPELAGSAVLVGADGTAVRRGGAPTLAFQFLEDDPVVDLVEGREPRGGDEVVVETGTLEAAGLDVGDRTRVVVAGGDVRDVEVVGRVEFGALAGSTLVLFDAGTAQELFAPDGTVPAFSVEATDLSTDQGALATAVADVLPEGAEAITGQAKSEEDTAAIRDALGFINTFLLVFAGISLVVGTFIIWNTFSMLVAQRTRELALLRAVGAGARQVELMVLAEAAVVGLVGGAIGLVAGIGLAALLQVAVGQFGLEISGGLPVTATTVVVSLLIGLVVTVVAAALPARRASRIAPVAAMRDEVALPEGSLRRRAGLAVVLLVLGLETVPLALWRDSGWSGWALAACALLLLGAFLVGAAPVARPVLRLLGKPFAAASRTVGRMARGNAVRNPRRTAVTASALMIGLALVTAVSVLSSSATQSTRAIVDEVVTADLVLNGGFTGFSPKISEQVREVDGVRSVASFGAVPMLLGGEQTFGLSSTASDLDDSIDVTMRQGELAALDDGEVLVSRSEAEDRGVAVGSVLRGVVGTDTDAELTVGGVFEDNPALGSPYVVPADLARRSVPTAQQVDLTALVTLERGADAEAVRAEVVETVRPYVVVAVQDRGEYVDAQADQIQQLLLTIYVLLALSVVIAVLGIVNTLALSVFERTREIGLLRAVGLTRTQLRRMITAESVMTALYGAVLGVVLGAGLGVLLQRYLVDDGLTELVVPWSALAWVLLLAGVVGVVAAVAPAVRAARLNVLQAIATD
ncbi:ABC transporter permease [Thalassiella azotivora]